MIIYTPFRPFGHDGVALRWVILIHSKQRDNEGLLAHEQIHIEQMKQIGTMRYLLNYFLNHWLGDSTFRAQVEHEAYKKGSKFPNGTIVHLLSRDYGVSKELAEEVVSESI